MRAVTKFTLKLKHETIDVVFVMPPKGTPGWILNAICSELAHRFEELSVRLVHIDEELPFAKTYFFSHYAFYYRALRRFTPARLGRSYVFATHLEPGKNRMSDRDVARLLALSDGVICMNTKLRETLASQGLPDQLAHVVVGAADRSMFLHHKRRNDGAVGFSAAFYARKSPERIFDIVSRMPHRNFILLGRGWRSWEKFGDLSALPNFVYAEPEYKDYPSWYARMSVFCSVSVLEGGPIPLIESMFCNVVPVASRTGFAPDVIQHGDNGFLFDVDAPVSEICHLIAAAFEVRRDVDEIAQRCDWSYYAGSIAKIMGINLTRSSLIS